MRHRLLLILLSMSCCLATSVTLQATELYDAHIHYSQDVWSDLPAPVAIDLLREQGIKKAMVSSTPTEGAELLYQQAPDLVVPMLRPYKNWRSRFQWFNDPALKSYITEHLKRAPYRGIGEFHVFGDDALSDVVLEVIEIARSKQLVLHAHSDYEGIVNLLNNSKGVDLIWAHGGFDVPVEKIRYLLEIYPSLYIELSYREGIVDEEQTLTRDWYQLFSTFPQRFLLGHDTYKPSRWAELPDLVASTQSWLSQLPDDIRLAISQQNFDRLFVGSKSQ